jgi:hypothetical protein
LMDSCTSAVLYLVLVNGVPSLRFRKTRQPDGFRFWLCDVSDQAEWFWGSPQRIPWGDIQMTA